MASETVLSHHHHLPVFLGRRYNNKIKNANAITICKSLLPKKMVRTTIQGCDIGHRIKNNNSAVHRKRSVVVQVLSQEDIICSVSSANNASIEILNAWNDEYNGIIIDSTSLPSNAQVFTSMLRRSLSLWKSKGKKGVWLKLYKDKSNLVPIAIEEGFMYHHAEPGYVMLTYWIPMGKEDEPCLLPQGPSHQIGIAGFVINDKKEILVVKEKCSCSCFGVWKLPTGYINKSEELFSGAVREVREETGIETTFMELLAFRHVHQVCFEKSDLLFVCMLKPQSLEIKNIDEREIEDAKWITADELLSQKYYEEDEMMRKIIEICMARSNEEDNEYNKGFIPRQIASKFDGKISNLYYQNNANHI